MENILEPSLRFDLFLSYCREDGRFAHPLVTTLTENGANLFVDACQWDQREVYDEHKLEKLIDSAVARAGAGVIMWSRVANGRKWITFEIDKLVGRSEADRTFPLFVIKLDGTHLPQNLSTAAVREFSPHTVKELNELAPAIVAALHLQLKPQKGSARVHCPHCNAEEAWNTIFCRVCKKHVYPQCSQCGAKAHCRRLDVSGGEIYFAEFEIECHGLHCDNRDSRKLCAGHAGEGWQPQECPYCEFRF